MLQRIPDMNPKCTLKEENAIAQKMMPHHKISLLYLQTRALAGAPSSE